MNHELYLEVRRYTRLLLSRKRVVVVAVLLVMTLGMAASFLLPKKYEATSTVFIEQSVIGDLVKGIAVTPSMEAKIKVLALAMLSRESLSQVLRILDKDVYLNTDAEREEYIATLRDRISIKLDEKRGVFFITYADWDPVFARDLVNTITQVYIESNTAAKRNESLEATRFLSAQIESFKKRIDVVEDEVNRYKAEHGMQLAVDETIIRYEISESEKKLEAIRGRRFALETQQQLLPSGGGDGGNVAEMERQLKVLKTAYTDSHPKVVRLKDQIAVARANPQRGGSGAATQTRAMIRAELEGIRMQEEAELRTIEDKRLLLREMPTIRTGLEELLRKKQNETEIYNQLVTRYGQSEVSKQMEIENKSMTFRIVDPAVLPEIPVFPNRPLIIFGSLVLGIGTGLALVILPYMMGGAVRSVADLRVLNQRVLAVLPVIPKPEEERRRRKADRIFMAGALVYFSLLLVVGILEAMGIPYLAQVIGRMSGWRS
ncbi:XrtA system polysaccharide chain length determinant [Desulfomicrobium salsuginis]